MRWAYAFAFRAGAGHEECEDVCICEAMGGTLVAAVADGAGSAQKSRRGASIACHTFLELAVPLYSGSVDPSCLIAAIQERIPAGEAEEHSCTLVGMVADSRGAMIVQVGDGAAVTRQGSPSPVSGPAGPTPSAAGSETEEGGYVVPLWPEETEFLNLTFFITRPGAEQHLHVRRLDAPIDELALFSDGLQHLVLDLKTRSPHQPFFTSVFERLGRSPGHDLKASWWLERTLGSEPVTRRTDDDTSIVIARRLPC